MDEMNINPLRIVEDDMPLTISNSDNESDNDSNDGEVFDFSASEIEELEGCECKTGATHADDVKKKRNSLLIIEDKDLIMESREDFNNNCSSHNNIHRLSLQIESGDSESLVMTNETVNRTIIRISSSNGIDFGESNDALDAHEQCQQQQQQHSSDRDESDVDSADHAIVNILEQIDEIVSVQLRAKASNSLTAVTVNRSLSVCVLCIIVHCFSSLSYHHSINQFLNP
jgi:hypothetical protein